MQYLLVHGITGVGRPTHAGGLLSDDKLTYQGSMFDIGSSLGSSGGRWFTDFLTVGGEGDDGPAPGPLNFDGSLTAPFTEGFVRPPPANYLDLPVYEKPPAFSYPDFQIPDFNTVLNDPGYKFRLGEGTRAINNTAAARGSLYTGGTFKGLQDYAQNFASGEAQNVYDRAAQGYTLNRSNAAANYMTNYGTQFVDPYQFETGRVNTTNTNRQTQATNSYQNAWNEFLQRERQFRSNQSDAFDRLFRTAELGSRVNE
jgi:hypothetical protein